MRNIASLRPASELAERFEHGTRMKYKGGCHCVPCRAANSRYETVRLAERKAGNSNRIVSSRNGAKSAKEVAAPGSKFPDASGPMRAESGFSGLYYYSFEKMEEFGGHLMFQRHGQVDRFLGDGLWLLTDWSWWDAQPNGTRIVSVEELKTFMFFEKASEWRDYYEHHKFHKCCMVRGKRESDYKRETRAATARGI